ncbi:putative FMN binding oxidoreductase [Lentithecium fluviatile CBS 122367]|uniref:Putative FMN binding oxidoreductase n=1 Tax=Lentithecium fluviatile CBS 122367 TaxID=1168545 RepID=A0A6G1IM81_9PLEO|nr:putative FMN binding oxidoreductase [Lentithecium fluviatile CBS 122367]
MSPKLGDPLTMPCGLIFPNRLIKAAMSEGMADKKNNPDAKYVSLYSTWSKGGWGGILTGEVEISPVYTGGPSHVTIPPTPTPTTKSAWSTWALASQAHNTPTLPQLVHPGRQSPAASGTRSFFAKSIAPSAVGMHLGPGVLDWVLSKVLFGTPREMTVSEIDEVVQQFAAAAKLAWESGFKGVQIHAAHGFLLTQFLSGRSNKRMDKYGGSPANRARIVVEVIRAVRSVVPEGFCVGIKVNSADVGGRESLEESLEQIGLIAAEAVDFIEISGGSMENLRMAAGDRADEEAPVKASTSTLHREAFFLSYARAVRERYPDVVLMLTGGFRSRQGMQEALDCGACDLVGVGRPAVIWPRLAGEVLLNEAVSEEEAKVRLGIVRPKGLAAWVPVKLVGAGVDVMYYVKQILRLGVGKKTVAPPEQG